MKLPDLTSHRVSSTKDGSTAKVQCRRTCVKIQAGGGQAIAHVLVERIGWAKRGLARQAGRIELQLLARKVWEKLAERTALGRGQAAAQRFGPWRGIGGVQAFSLGNLSVR